MNRILSLISLKPSSWLLYGTGLYLVNIFLGPYTYEIADPTGIYYFVFCWIVFFSSLLFGERVVMSKHRVSVRTTAYALSPSAEKKLFFYMLVILLAAAASVFYFYYIADLFADSRSVDLRMKASISGSRVLGEGGAWMMRFVISVVSGAPAAYLLVCQLHRTHFSFTKTMSIICLATPAMLVFLQGGRNAAIYVVFLAILAGFIQIKRGLPFFSNSRWHRLGMSMAIIFVFIYSGFLFIYRGHAETAQELSRDVVMLKMASGNDVRLKQVYLELDNATGNYLSPLFMGSFYLGHSLPFFSALFERSSYDVIFWGAYHLRALGYIFRFFGLEFTQYLDIVESQPFFGLYPTAVQGFLLDFGLYGTFFFIAIFGFLLGAVYRRTLQNRLWAIIFLPICQIMAFVFPIYPITWGASDFVVYAFIAMIFLLGGNKGILLNDR
jgi:oligosaccharide repeat unit polymerase